MSRRLKPYALTILTTLIIALLLGPPLSFATKLPTACNIFNKTQIEKSGPCGHQALFPNEKSFGNEVLFSSSADFGISDCLLFQNSFSYLSVPSVPVPKPAAPLRC